MNDHITRLIIIFIVCGLVGGIVSYYLTPEDHNEELNDDFKFNDMNFRGLILFFSRKGIFKNILFGLTASFLVPLFLNMISSSLLHDSSEDGLKYFNIAGFCLAAASSAKAFIVLMSNKVFKMIEDNKEGIKHLRKDVETIVEEKTELDMGDEDQIGTRLTNDRSELTEKEKTVLSKFVNTKYIYRSISRLVTDTEIEIVEMNGILGSLISKGYLDQIERSHKIRFYITTRGRILANRLGLIQNLNPNIETN